MNPQEHRVREVAYQIWESEGKPSGQHIRHWEMACKLAEASNDGSGLSNLEVAVPPAKTRKKAVKAEASQSPDTSLKPAKAEKPKVEKVKAEKSGKAEDKPKKAKAAKLPESDAQATEDTSPKAKKSRKKAADSEPLVENESA